MDQVSRIAAKAWIEGKGWVGKGNTRDEARNNLIKSLKVRKLQFYIITQILPNSVLAFCLGKSDLVWRAAISCNKIRVWFVNLSTKLSGRKSAK